MTLIKKSFYMKRIILILTAIILAQPLFSKGNFYHMLVGTYTNSGKSQGIYSFDIDMNNLESAQKSVTTGVSDPSYLVIAPDRKFVYSVNESLENSSANAFSFDIKTAKLTFLNRSLTNSAGPCYISAAPKHVFTANYKGGSISVFSRNADGSLSDIRQKIQHSGKGTVPHVHQVLFSPDRKYLLVNDLGIDMITVYRYSPDSQNEILTACDSFPAKQGSGPRHSVFSKDGKRLYVLHELDCSLTVFDFNNGKLKLIQENSVVRTGKAVPGAADIHLSPDGKFLYATNRATANDITCFSVAKDGKIAFRQQIPTGGKGPRNFAITPDGKYIFVAHQYTDNIVIFKRNIKTGILSDTGKRIVVCSPVCLVFF